MSVRILRSSGHRASGIGHRAWGIGHRASGIGHRASGIKKLLQRRSRYSFMQPNYGNFPNRVKPALHSILQYRICKAGFTSAREWREAMKRYLIELALCITVYVCACLAAAWLRANLAIGPVWQPVIALLPMIPGTCFLLIIMRYFRRIDELERRIQAESLMFSFSGTAIITFSYGFLETAGFARLSMFCVWPVMAILWSIGYFVSKRRYQ